MSIIDAILNQDRESVVRSIEAKVQEIVHDERIAQAQQMFDSLTKEDEDN